jgi:hypothetical protein
MRFPSGGLFTVGASVKLSPPVAFATGKAGIGFGAGAGAGIGAGASAGIGVGASAGAGFGLSASAGAGIGVSATAAAGFKASTSSTSGIGGKSSAGVTARAGAFAGLRVGVTASAGAASLNVNKLIPSPPSMGLATSAGAKFDATGRATISGSASLTADVGKPGTFRARIQFEEK